MAVQVMSEVWEHSQASGTRLLILLALADRARKEDAVCWPGIGAIAQQARVTPRDVQHHLAGLQEMGELRVVRRGGRGPGDTTVWQVCVGRYKEATAFTLRDPDRVQATSQKSAEARVKEVTPSGADKGANTPQERVQPVSPDPLVTDLDPSEPKEPSGGGSPQPPDPSSGDMVAHDGILAGTPLAEDPSTGRLRIAR